jgi:uncharacterized membrane protein
MVINTAFVSSITALVAVIVSPIVTVYVSKKQIKSSVVSINRQQWINRLRDEIARFVQEVKHVPSAYAADAINFEQATSKHGEIVLKEEIVKLMLNPNEAEHQELIKLMSAASNKALNAINTKRGLSKVLDEATVLIIAKAQNILKTEWERVKRGD